MEDRYEIKGKIGQGGLGAVYKAHDVRMNREVAIKRIIANNEDASLPEEATRQLMKEAGSLASLQHPNIVTIYDVGEDEDGPFVVMELLTGDTLEEIIGQGSSTWQDFRQLANQTLEALIAAQELHLVHRDLKPSNIMLTWLPSGKFQVKIVDFGLAKLSAKPSLQTIDQSDGVFGSIYFMAPEQFERVPIDLKADLYAIGCVFYYALTGTYPFDGETAAEVMASHLQHHVTPIREIREGIPVWACEWIMWLLNRQPADRPESARQALQVFLENESVQDPPMSEGAPAPAQPEVKRPRLLIPGSAPVPEVVKEAAPTQPKKTASAPKPLLPPQGSKPSVHTTAQVVHASKSTPAPETGLVEESAAAETVPSMPPEEISPELASAETVPVQPPAEEPATESGKNGAPALTRAKPSGNSAPPLLKKAGATGPAKPALVTPASGVKPALASGKPTAPVKPALSPTGPLKPSLAVGAPTASALTPTRQAPEPGATAPVVRKKKKGLSPTAMTMIAIVLGVLAVLLGFIMLKKSGDNAEAKLYNEMIDYAKKGDATELPVDERKLDILLRNAVSVASNENRYIIYKALYLAKATDGTDIDKRIAEFATTREMIPDVRVVLIRDVLRKRNNPEIIGTLLDFARSTDEPEAAVAAIEATRFMSTEDNLPEFLEIIQTTQNDRIRKAAEENAAKIIEKSTAKTRLGETLATAYGTAFDDVIRHSMLRLLGRTGGDKAIELVKENLESSDDKNKIAAIVALATWQDEDGYEVLIEYLASSPEINLRSRAYESAFQHVSDSSENTEDNWTLLAEQTKTQEEQMKLVRGLATVDPQPWAIALLDDIIGNSDYDKVIDLAERAKIRLKDIQKTKGDEPDDEE